MKILIINGSPKINGRIAAVLKEIESGIKSSHEIKFLNLIEMKNLKDCIGCMQCQKVGKCVLRDDIETIEQYFMQSDVIVLGTPIHWGNMSALMLKMFERLFGFLIEEQVKGTPKARAGKGKKVVFVTACSTPWPFHWLCNQSRAGFSRMKEICKYSGMKIIDTFVLTGTLQMKEIPAKYLKKAKKIGENL